MYKSSTEFMNISLNKIASILFVSVGITTYEVNEKFTRGHEPSNVRSNYLIVYCPLSKNTGPPNQNSP